MNDVCKVSNHQQLHNCQNAEKHAVLFMGEKTVWLPIMLGLSVRLLPVHLAQAERTWQMLYIFQKLCLTDTSIPTMIYTHFIFVLTNNPSNDNPFLAYN